MEAKHTPGPWEASIQRSKDGRDLGWIVEHVNGRIGWASLAYAHANKEADEADPAREANARLIAAAPELLEALMDCREALRRAGATGELAVVDAAIEKATK